MILKFSIQTEEVCVDGTKIVHNLNQITAQRRTLEQYSTDLTTPMFEELWSEINDSQGEIFDLDIPELKEDEEKFDINEYLNSNIDYWYEYPNSRNI